VRSIALLVRREDSFGLALPVGEGVRGEAPPHSQKPDSPPTEVASPTHRVDVSWIQASYIPSTKPCDLSTLVHRVL